MGTCTAMLNQGSLIQHFLCIPIPQESSFKTTVLICSYAKYVLTGEASYLVKEFKAIKPSFADHKGEPLSFDIVHALVDQNMLTERLNTESDKWNIYE